MKPYEALQELASVVASLESGQHLAPHHRAWFLAALRKRLVDPAAHLDGLLLLRTGRGGRAGGAHSPIPGRNHRLRTLAAGMTGSARQRAEAISHQWREGQLPGLQGRALSPYRIARIIRESE